ncbi:MAG: hypothetical protein OCD76_16000 [Reichenbachiella sp.]
MKDNPVFASILFLGLSFLSLYVYDINHNSELTIEKAIAPVQYLSNARSAIVKLDYNGSIREMDAAISAMKVIEQYADSVSIDHIEKAIADLRNVEKEIRNDSLVIMDLNKAYFHALNSIAYANLIISEKNLDKGQKYKAMRFMNATFTEMIKSLEFTSDERYKERENQVIDDVRNLLAEMKKNKHEKYAFDYDSINQEVEELIDY